MMMMVTTYIMDGKRTQSQKREGEREREKERERKKLKRTMEKGERREYSSSRMGIVGWRFTRDQSKTCSHMFYLSEHLQLELERHRYIIETAFN